MEPREWDDEFITRWEQQYYKLGKKEKATPALIAKEINRTSNADFMFKINFLMLFASTMGTLDSGGKCPYNVLRNVKEDDDIADIDWCGYILDCLEGSKHNWKDVKKSGNYYYGPLTLLNEEDQSDCINLYQGANVYFEEEIEDETSPATKEDYYQLVESSLDRISKERKEMLETLVEGCTKYNKDRMMYKLSKRYMKMFNVKDLLIPESASDGDSDDENEYNSDNDEEENEDLENVDVSVDDATAENVEKQNEAAVNEPVVDKIGVDEPKVQEVELVDEPAVDEPAVEEPSVKEPTADELAVEEPAVKEPKKQETKEQKTLVQTPQLKLDSQEEEFWKDFQTPEIIKPSEEPKKPSQEDDFWDTHISSGENINETIISEATEKSSALKSMEPGPKTDVESLTTQATQKAAKNSERKIVETRPMQKVTRQSARASYTPPSFSLGMGLSQLDTTTDANIKTQSTEENKEVEEEITEKRVRKPSRFLVSPYMNKKTDVRKATHPDEMMVTDELFSMMGDPMEFVFETDCGAVTIRDNMQTLAPTLKIEANVIDSFAAVLNYEEKKNNKGVRMKHYFHTAMISKNMIEGKMKSEKKQIEAFHESMESEFKKDETAMAMQHIEWAFFPIIAHHHYYLVVFNLFKGTSVIIDNSISGANYDSKYKHVCDLLKNLFSKHLERYKHPKASDVRDKKTTIMKLKWGTKNNEVDCGVFLMMHMENYNGETATKWNLGFPTEEENQTMELIKMRVKYATKMLMHEVNKNRAMMSEKANQFAREYTDKDEKQQMIKENIKKKKAEQDAQHVPSAV
ncbi:ulp1 protease family, C-terminal catalytic domain-containing protein [Artemisia annua]|uniref:Ulp1 protease family, C-terminal catalytic domain-containing protein n=1 Tax=Artemisia annua TaxID=35608 RepID=A0A2U1PRW0_ARTAN|nr:ulp1 protease family, C-terminal catalytic domain-containing protein [Artemisia annua]